MVYRDIKHGVNVAELVQDIATSSEIIYAQANSPRQLYQAARWLVAKDVDIIVHAGGYPYDGLGDGTSPLDMDLYEQNSTITGTNQHSAIRYYPSPLVTIDEFVNSTSGPIWINAAGNTENATMRISNPTTIRITNPGFLGGNDSTTADFIVFDTDITGTGNLSNIRKTCQLINRDPIAIYIYSMIPIHCDVTMFCGAKLDGFPLS